MRGHNSSVKTHTCGSEPARDGVESVISMLTDPPLSRASSLPQLIVGDTEFVQDTGPMWERACSRIQATRSTYRTLSSRPRSTLLGIAIAAANPSNDTT